MSEIVPPQAVSSHEEYVNGELLIKHEYADKSYGIERPEDGTLTIYHDDGSWDAYKLKDGSTNDYILTTKYTKDGACYEVDENGEIISYSTKLPTPVSLETERTNNKIITKQIYPDGSYGIEDENQCINRYYPDGKKEFYQPLGGGLYRLSAKDSSNNQSLLYDDNGTVRNESNYSGREFYGYDKEGYVNFEYTPTNSPKEHLIKRTFYPNGQTEEEIKEINNAKGDVKIRKTNNYYPNGQIKSAEKEAGNTTDRQEYYEDGRLKREYKNTSTDNSSVYKEKTYYPNGQIKTEEKHKQNQLGGTKVDKKRSYYENGQIETESKHTKSSWGAVETHKFREYNPDGSIKTKAPRETVKEKFARLRREKAELQQKREELKTLRETYKGESKDSALLEYQKQKAEETRESISIFAIWQRRKMQNA